MNLDPIVLTVAPASLRYWLSMLAFRGWQPTSQGFEVSVAGTNPAGDEPPPWGRDYATEVFGDDGTWNGPVLTVRGETAKAFLRLYEQAVKFPVDPPAPAP